MVKTDLFYLFICCLFVQCQAGKRFILFSVSQFVFIFFTNFKRDFFLTKIISAPDAVDIEISALTESMFQASTPNLFNEITVNLQRKTYSSSLVDDAPSPYVIYSHPFSIKMVNFLKKSFFSLLTVSNTTLSRSQTIIKLRALFDNYELDTSVVESVTPAERREEDEFLDKVLDTQVMKIAMNYLKQKGWHTFL